MGAALNGNWGARCKQQPLPCLWLLEEDCWYWVCRALLSLKLGCPGGLSEVLLLLSAHCHLERVAG